MKGRVYDIAIIGGGVNGCGIARDAAGRGLSVFLAEKSDLASGTSSKSTKLIHGGLRYLEHYEFKLVRESLKEREVLWAMAPHIIWPLRFILPHNKGLRPAWLIRLGLFLYDQLGGRKILPATKTLDLTKDEAGRPLNSAFKRGFEYSDCGVDDARLVIVNAIDAADLGADIRPRTEVVSVARVDKIWQLGVADTTSGKTKVIKARTLINATGPWISTFIADTAKLPSNYRIRLVKGSHIVVPKIFDHNRAYIFQNADGRIIFAIPYQTDFTLIGTTDEDYHGANESVAISQSEIEYLCVSAGEYFTQPIVPDDVVWSYSGVRPLFDEGDGAAQKATRDYVLDLNGTSGEPPLLNIFGGKITTYRHLAEDALSKLAPWIKSTAAPWTNGVPLPGGDFPVDGFDKLVADLKRQYSGIGAPLLERLARQHGTRARDLLAGAVSPDDLGQHFGAGLYRQEVDYLVCNEWARTADDIVWRRTKLGLRMSVAEISVLDEWLKTNGTADTN